MGNLFEDLHHPFLLGGVSAPLFLDVSATEPRQWYLVGEDEAGAPCRRAIPRGWALELLAWDCRPSDEPAAAAARSLAAELLSGAEAPDD